MKSKRIWIAAAIPVLAVLWYLFRPELLFVDKQVNEAFPGEAAPTAVSGKSAPLATGRFHSVAHDTMGEASIHELEGGRRVLRLTDFSTSNGPDVRVYLVKAADASDSETVKDAGFVELGKLKGTEGSQNYDVPANVDLAQYRAVTIWCARFGVNFGTAPLSAAAAPSGPVTVAKGTFHGVAHDTEGEATLYRLPDGKRVLRFTGFTTSNGPDVQVYLGKAADASDSETVTKAGFFHVGALKGTEGDQNYELPADLNLDEYRSVTIWCRRFGVNFATAPLARGTT